MKILRKIICDTAIRVARSITPSSPVPHEIKRILAIVHGGLGDRLMTLPALRALKEKYSTAFIHVVWCGEAIPVENEFESMEEVGKSDFLKQLKIIKRGWDLLFVNSIGIHSATTEIAAAFSNIPLRIGPARDDSYISGYTISYKVYPSMHVTSNNMDAINGEKSISPYPYLININADYQSQNKYVLIHPGCRPAYRGYEQNRWPAKCFKELADRIRKEIGIKVAALMGPDENDELKEYVKKWGVEIIEPASVKELFVLVKQSILLIGNDSGPSHVAAAVGTPEVILFGPSDPRRSAPVSERAICICAGHAKPFYGYETLPEYVLRPMEMIKVETVFEAVKKILS